MKKLSFLALLLVGALLTIGCASADKALGNTTVATAKGDLWYAKTKKFLIFKFGHQVFYCPPPTQPGTPPKCLQAKLHEKGEGAAAPDFGGGFGAPAAPAAPGYGAPAAPGYGVPAAPGYGAPPAPGYGAPPETPGYGPAPSPAPAPVPGPPPPGPGY